MNKKIFYRKPLAEEFSEMGKVANLASYEANKRVFPRWIYRRASVPVDIFKKEDGGRWRIAIVDDYIVGICGVYSDGYLVALYVHPSYQGLGIGKTLLAWAEERVYWQGHKKIEAHAELGAMEFYLKNGYRVLSAQNEEIKTRGRLPLVKISKAV